jgi:hypothetical protein
VYSKFYEYNLQEAGHFSVCVHFDLRVMRAGPSVVCVGAWVVCIWVNSFIRLFRMDFGGL